MTQSEQLQDNYVKVLLFFSILMLIAQFFKLPIIFALSMPAVIVPWMALGAMRNGKIGRGFKVALSILFSVWIIGFLAMNLMDHSVFTGTLLGHTKGAAIMIYAIWIIPFFVISVFFGKVFDKEYITSEDVTAFEVAFGEESGYSEALGEEFICSELVE